MAFEYADERLRINSLRKNTILPKELQVQCGGLAYLLFVCFFCSFFHLDSVKRPVVISL